MTSQAACHCVIMSIFFFFITFCVLLVNVANKLLNQNMQNKIVIVSALRLSSKLVPPHSCSKTSLDYDLAMN